MTTGQLLRTAWEWEPSINIGCAAWVTAYFWKVPAPAWRRFLFVLGTVVMVLALESPLDALGDDYLFSAHMAQHLLLILVVPPLWILGIPEQAARGFLRRPRIAATERVLGRPGPAWWSAIGVMTLWHVPVFYNYALAHETVHIFQHLSFLVTATMFWWPVLHPLPERRMAVGPAILYLFAAVAENSVLGIILTFTKPGHYPAYLHPDDDLGALGLIRDGWGMSAADDQRLGGLLMWIPGCSVYFAAILGLIAHWYAQPEPEPALPAGPQIAQRGGAR